MISHIHKCIFVHIPKTGGSSIEKIIWPEEKDRTLENLWMGFIDRYHNKYQTGGLQHLLAKQIIKETGNEIFQNYFKFSFIRNPWDKAISQYFYMKRRNDLQKFTGMDPDTSFKEYLGLIRKKKHVQWEKQSAFLFDSNGNLLVDFIGRFENFNDDLLSILKHLGIEHNSIPHLNKTEKKHYSYYYDSETKGMIEDMYADDIRLFGYKFHYNGLVSGVDDLKQIINANNRTM